MKTDLEKLKLVQKKLRIAREGLRNLAEHYRGTECHYNIAQETLDEMRKAK